MKINWLANAPWSQTGYGTQTRVNVPRFKAAGHEMSITAFYGLEGGILNWNGIPVYPRAYHAYGQDIAGAHAHEAGADIMISLMDAWVCEPKNWPNMKWCPWFPIDHDPLPPAVRVKVEQAFHRIVMSKFGCQMAAQAGLDFTYVPHGIETGVFKPVDRKAAREKVELPADAFIVGMVAANKGNPSRKAFTQQIEAFSRLKQNHKDAVMYIHSNKCEHGENAGVNLPEICAFLGLVENKDVFFPNQYQNLVGFPDNWLNLLYNSFDVLTSVSTGEGFGIPIVEAQSAGCPVIVGDWTSMSELCFSGWKVSKAEAERTWSWMSAWQYFPHIDAIAERLQAAYQKKDNQVYRNRAREGASAYDADKVYAEYWVPTLKAIQDKLEKQPPALAAGLVPEHQHQWAGIGLWNKDGSMSVPCITCDDELVIKGDAKIINCGGFHHGLDLTFVPDNDGITKIVTREIKRDYQLDNLGLKNGDTVIDIGAHKGIVSCYLAKKYPGAQVLAYEPVKENYTALLKNIELNHLDNVTAFNLAVTGDGRDVTIAKQKGNSGGCSIYAKGSDDETVKSVTLESIFEFHKIERLPLLKIDCEGAEFEIISSLNGSLAKIERLRGEFHRSAGEADKLLEYVKASISDVVVTVQG